MPLPAFAQNTPAADVKVGDLMWGDTKSTRGWVLEVESNESETDKAYRFEIIDTEGSIRRSVIKKIQVFGLDAGGAMIVRTLGSMTGGDAGMAGLQGMLVPMLAMGGDLGDIGDMLPFMFMNGGLGGTPAAGGAAANPMAAMFGGAGGVGSMLPFMMQMKMMKKLLGDESKTNARHGAGRRPSSIFDERGY
jgi:hypothetical protein